MANEASCERGACLRPVFFRARLGGARARADVTRTPTDYELSRRHVSQPTEPVKYHTRKHKKHHSR